MQLTAKQVERLKQLGRELAINFDVPARDQMQWAAADLGVSMKRLESMRSELFRMEEAAQ